jgi:uncharacterized OB-fold protein
LRWDTRPASGRGRVYSYVVPRHPPPPEGEEPPVIALVELDEGVRLVSNLRDITFDEVVNDMPVDVFFDEVEPGVRLPQFRASAGDST